MDQAITAMQNQLKDMILVNVVLIGVILFGILYKGKDLEKQRHFALLSIVSIILLIFLTFVSTIPFIRDYSEKNIVVVRGVYNNVLGDRKRSTSGLKGIYSVTLTVEEEKIKLTTAPGRKDVFIRGEHEVVAYYLPNARVLLHIELKEDESQQGDKRTVPLSPSGVLSLTS